MVSAPAVLAGAGHAFPDGAGQQELWDGFFSNHFGGRPLARRIFTTSGVRYRHAVANPLIDDVSSWSTGRRMERFVREALPLGKDAVAGALAAADIDPGEIGMFAVASCTGYATPGLDILLARDLGMAADVQRLAIGHMGCYAALPGIGAVADYVAHRGRAAVLLCVELTSLHLQPPTTDVDQVVAHALFSDAASAVVVRPGGQGLAVVDTVARTDVANADLMTWDVTDHGFRMGLSPKVPDVLSLHVAGAVSELLDRHQLTLTDVDSWAVHPGGPRIVDVVQERLGLKSDAVEVSHDILATRGNCSSATVLLVIDELQQRAPLASGRHMVALAFGPGLTLYATLLQAR